jgi:hypothetical protein
MKGHATLMRFRQCLLDECTEQLQWPRAEASETPAAFRTLWVLLVWWRERPDELRGVFNKAFTRMYTEFDATRVWHQIDAQAWLDMVHDGEKACHGYELTAEERRPQLMRRLPASAPVTPFVRVQLDLLYQARQLLTNQLGAWDTTLPERFATEYDPEELVTLHAMLRCTLIDSVEWMTSKASFQVLTLMETDDDKRDFWLQSTRALMRSLTHSSFKGQVPEAPPGASGAAAPQTLFPGLFEARAYNAFRIHAGRKRLPMYSRAWLQLLHFAYEAAARPAPRAFQEAAEGCGAYGDIQEGQGYLFEEIYALLGCVPHLHETMRPWIDLSILPFEDEGVFWEELGRYMLAVLLRSRAEFEEAWCEADAQGMWETIAAL